MMLLGYHIDEKLIQVHQDLKELVNSAKSMVIPENLELAVPYGELLKNPKVPQTASKLPLVAGSLSYYLFEEVSHEMQNLDALFQKLGEVKRLNFTAIEVYQLIKYYEVRVKRFMRVLEPRFTVSKIPNINKNPQVFKVIRGYWYSDDGKEQRSINKTFSNVETEFNLRFKEFYEELGYIVTQPTEKLGKANKSIVDMIITKGQTRLALELKEDNCLKLFTKYHLWEMYKNIYQEGNKEGSIHNKDDL